MVNYTHNVENLILNPPDVKLFEEVTGLPINMVESIMPLFENIRPHALADSLRAELRPLNNYGDVMKQFNKNLNDGATNLFEGIEADSISIFRLAYSLIGGNDSNSSEDRRTDVLKRSADVIGELPSTINIVTSHPEVSEINLYTSLKDLLARNNKRWGDNYHLSNAHDAIIEYLNNEIKSITTNQVVNSIDEKFYQQLMEMILFDTVPVMYRSVDYIKTQISDIQTLIFDLMVIVTSYIRTHRALTYISKRRTVAFARAADNLYTTFRTSIPKSKLYNEDECSNYTTTPYIGYERPYVNKFDGKYQGGFYDNRIPHENILECLYIMKACSSEVSIMFRKVISDYITKAYQLTT
jgi:hypothetical protein